MRRTPVRGARVIAVAKLGTVSVLATFALAPPASSQPLLAEQRTKAHLPPWAEISYGAVAFDVDGDGDIDLAVANDGQNRLHVNDGHAHFGDVVLPVDADDTRAVAAGDLDGDGHPDLVWANDQAQNRTYLWTAAGYVDATARLPARSDRTQAVALGDVDRDGDLDVLFGNYQESHRLYLNDGAGSFVDATATHLPAEGNRYRARAMCFADVDADGDLDVWIASVETVQLLLNDGGGHFTDVSDLVLPTPRPGGLGLACADLDGDSDLDLVFGTARGVRTRTYRNDGIGRFTDVTEQRLPVGDDETNAVVAGDLDGDGDLDLVLGNGTLLPVEGARNAVWRNDGGGVFARTESARVSADRGVTGAVVAADFDGDGDLDWVALRGAIANPLPNQMHLNDGRGRFAVADEAVLPVEVEVSMGATVGDVDGDGDLDLVFANQTRAFFGTGGRNQLFLYDAGEARYVEAVTAQFTSEPATTRAVVLADVDGDSDLDLLFADSVGCRLLVNDGTGRFVDDTENRLPPADLVSSIAVGDVDADGDLDLVVARGILFLGAPDRLFLNDGSGHFADVSATHLPQIVTASSRIVLADVDGDGDLDVVVADAYGTAAANRVYINDGTGRFIDETAVRLPDVGGLVWSVVAFDADRDGDLDLVFGDNEQDTFFENDGHGFFQWVPEALPIDPDPTVALAAGDLDGDGDLDLVLGKSGGSGSGVLENDGHGRFADRTRAFWGDGPGTAQWIEIADLDADGDQDVLVARSGGFGAANFLYANRTRHISAPWHFVPGREARLTVEAAPGRAGLFHLAIPLAASRRARVALPPFGELGLDPLQMVMLEPIYVPPLQGTATLSLTVPDNPALVGVTLYWQAVLLHPLQPARFANVVADAIWR
ncbi:MAG: VCBS repeat-containing protein [Planctomycetota bacterium]